ncbi:hypothetical protein V3C99_002962, partial [Haemonchus contortus]
SGIIQFWQTEMVLYWSQYVFIATNIVSFPLYLLIIVVCVKEYKYNPAQRAFNLLVISQGVMDILLMASYFFFGTLRLSELVNGFFWTYKDYSIAMWCFNQTYISAILRCFGVLVISFQRYISLCKSVNPTMQLINTSYRWILPMAQWIVPTLYSVPILIFSNATFKAPDNLEVMIEHKDITVATSTTAIFVTITFFLCSFCYVNILRFLVKNRYSVSVAVKRERRLYMQMMGLFVGFVLLFVFYVLQFRFSLNSDNDPIFTMRTIFPVISCFFSYVNIWMMLVLNEDIRRKLLALIRRGLAEKISTHMSTSMKAISTVNVVRF